MATTKKESVQSLIKKAQKVFNYWIRKRDSNDGYFTCISCGKTLPISQMNAGHYIPVTYSVHRFNENNCHGECIADNCFNEFHLIPYRKNLVEKIGLADVELLEDMRHEVKKWTRSELLEIIEKYKV